MRTLGEAVVEIIGDYSTLEPGARKAINDTAKTLSSGAGTAGQKAGGTLGKSFSDAVMGASSKGLNELKAEVNSAADKVSKASSRQAAAAREVAEAEKALDNARKSGKTSRSEMLSLEDKLVDAKTKAARADGQLARAQSGHASALKTHNAALRNHEKEVKDGAEASTQAKGKWEAFRSVLKGKLVTDLPSVEKDLEDVKEKSSGMKSMFAGGFGLGAGLTVFQTAARGIGGYLSAASEAADSTQKFVKSLEFGKVPAAQIDILTKATQTYADRTIYDLGEIRNTTASFAASGVKDAMGFTEAIGNLNAVAGGTADTFSSVTQASAQIMGAGKLTTENWNQVRDAIPTASAIVKKELKAMGAFTGNFEDAMAAGEITAEEYRKALVRVGSTDVAKSAAASATTYEGAWGNLEATITGGMANILIAIQPTVTALMNMANNALGPVFDAVTKGIEWVIGAAGALKTLLVDGDFTSAFSKAFHVEEDSKVVDFLFRVRDGAQGIYDLLINGDFTGAFSRAFGVEEDSPIVGFLLDLRDTLKELPGVAVDAFGWVTTHLPLLRDLGVVVGGIAGAWGAYTLAMSAYNAVTVAGGLLSWIGKISGLTKVWAGVQGALNAVMAMNPIMLVVLAIGALVTAFVLAYRNSETFRNIVNGALSSVMDVAKSVGAWFSGPFIGFFQAAWDGIKSGASAIGTFFVDLWNGITSRASAFFGALGAVFTAGWELVTGVVRWYISSCISVITTLWTWVSTTFRSIWQGLVGVFSGPINTARKVVEVFVAAIVLGFQTLWGWVSGFFAKSWSLLTYIIMTPLKLAAAGISAVWSGVRAGFSAVAGWVGTVFRAAWSVVTSVVTVPMNAARDAVGRVWSGIKSSFSAASSWVTGTWTRSWSAVTGAIHGAVNTAKTFVANRWSDIKGGFSAAATWVKTSWSASWNGIKATMTAPVDLAKKGIDTTLDLVKKAFERTVTAVKGSWSKIEGAIKSPISLAATKAVNPMIRGFNSLADKVGMGKNKLTEWKGFRKGGWTGWKGVNTPAGIVHGKEFVMDAVTTARAGGARAMEAIRSAVRSGWSPIRHGISARGLTSQHYRDGLAGVPGFKSGGYVNPVPGRGKQHSRLKYPWATWAGDFPVAMGTPIKAWKDGIVAVVKHLTTSYGKHVRINHTDGSSSLYAHQSSIGVSPGQQVTMGQIIGRVGSTGNSSGPHLHFETKNGHYAGGSGVADAVSSIFGKFSSAGDWLADKFSGATNFLKQGLGSGTFGNMVKWVPEQVGSGLKSLGGKLWDKLHDGLSGAGAWVKGKFGIGKNVERWRGVATEAAKAAGLPLSYIDLLLHRMNVESGGNPNAQNNWDSNARKGMPSQGLMQTIPLTFRAYAGPYAGRGIRDPFANIYAAIKYTLSRYGLSGIARAWGGRKGYANGTMNAVAGWHWVGERGPELMWTPGGSRVLDAQRSQRALAPLSPSQGASGASGSPGTSYGDIYMNVSVEDLQQLHTLEDFFQMLEKARATSRQTARSGKVSL